MACEVCNGAFGCPCCEEDKQKCPECEGTGCDMGGNECSYCRGTGFIIDEYEPDNEEN